MKHLIMALLLLTLTIPLIARSSNPSPPPLQWIQIPNSPSEVLSIAFINATLYAATRTQGLWSYDGTQWTQVQGLAAGPVCQLQVTPAKSLIACVVDSSSNPFTHDYRYANGQWKQVVNSGAYYEADHAIDVDGAIIQTSEHMIRRSTDDGQSYTDIGPVDPQVAAYCIAVGSTGIWYVGSENTGIYYSTDKGKTWKSLGYMEVYPDQLYPFGNPSSIRFASGQPIVTTGQGGVFLHTGIATAPTWMTGNCVNPPNPQTLCYPVVLPPYPDPAARDNTAHDVLKLTDGTLLLHGGHLYTSPDGSAWTRNDQGLPDTLLNTPYPAGRYSLMSHTLAYGPDGRVYVGIPAPGLGVWRTTTVSPSPSPSASPSPATTPATGIQVVSATYGGNVGATVGNATTPIASVCNGKTGCVYTVDYRVLGDPVPNKAKDYVVRYDCNGSTQVASAAAEAGLGSTVTLTCVGGTPSPSPQPSPTPTPTTIPCTIINKVLTCPLP
jgi:hypothetical protein